MTSGDCISRQTVLDGLASIAKVKTRSDAQKSLMGRIMFFVEQLSSVTPKEKTGHWVNAKVGKLFPSNDYKCSECGNLLDFDGVNCGRGDVNYCPNCGCHMIEPQESEKI